MVARPLTLLSAGILVVACSSGTQRTPFSDQSPAEPDPSSQDVTGAPPQTQATPVSPPAEAGAPPDAGGAGSGCALTAPSNKCGLVPQCGCAATETCDVTDASGGVACITAGKAAMGRPCTATSSCAQGLTCISGTCHAYCATPGIACSQPGTGACIQVSNGSGAAIPNLAICLATCDLRDPNACGGTTAAGTGVCVVDDKGNTDCESGGTGAENATCSATAACGPALVCVNITTGTTTTSQCKRWCRVGTGDCGGTKVCGGFATKVVVSAVEYGVCP